MRIILYLKQLLISLVFISGFVSCGKGDFRPVENAGIPLISKVLVDSEPFREYTYSEVNLVVEDKTKFSYTGHFYNSKNQLVQSDSYWDKSIFSSSSYVLENAMKRTEWVSPANTEKASYRTYQYNDYDQLSKITYNPVTMGAESYSTFEYDIDKRINKQLQFYENRLSSYFDYTYDNIGNLVKTWRYNIDDQGNAVLSTTTEYEFDDKHNPYRAFKRLCLPGINTNPNNIIKETYRIHFEVPSNIETTQIKTTTFEYNDQGYPVKVNGSMEYVYTTPVIDLFHD